MIKLSCGHEIHDIDYACDAFKQANNDLAKAAIRPDGYVLVPVEPTDKMLDIMHDLHLFGEMEEDIYKAMIQAAQEAE